MIQRAGEVAAHRGELLDAHADHVTDRSGIAAEPDVVALVRDARVVRGEQFAALGHVIADALRVGLVQQVYARQHRRLIAVPIPTDRHHVGGHAVVGEGAEPGQRLGPVTDLLRRGGRVLGGPLALIVEDHGHPGLGQPRARQPVIAQRGQIGTQLAHVAEVLAVLAGVRQHSGVVLLRTGLGLPPLEVADRVRAHGQMRQGITDQLAGLLAVVDRTPVHGAGRMLHQPPRVLARDAVHQRGGVGQLVEMLLTGGEVMVVRDEIDLVAPIVVVQTGAGGRDHEVRGQRTARGNLGEHVALGDVERLERIRAEPLEVQQLARVHEVALADEARRDDLREVVHALRPEGRAPRLVDRVDGAVALLAPALERPHRVVGVVEAVVAAVFVAHMPGDHIRVVLVVLGHSAAQVERVLAEDRAGGTPVLARARPAYVAVLVAPQHLGVLLGEPHRRRCGGGGQVDGDAGLAELVDDAVQPIEVVYAFLRLDLGPREDGDGHDVDAGLGHQADVLVPDLLGPLVGVVVAAVPDAGLLPLQGLRPAECSMCVLHHDECVLPVFIWSWSCVALRKHVRHPAALG